MFDVLEAQKRRPAMKKIRTMQAFSNEILKEQKLTIGVDLGDRWSFYCVLDEAGKIILEQKVATTPEAMKQTFGKIPRSLIALETGTVRHRSAKAQIHLTVIRARAELVSARTALVNAARGLVKSFGDRLPKCGTQQERGQ